MVTSNCCLYFPLLHLLLCLIRAHLLVTLNYLHIALIEAELFLAKNIFLQHEKVTFQI